MSLFNFFSKKIDTDLLKLSQITYGGEFYYNLRKYRQKEINVENTKFNKISDTLLQRIGNNKFFSYKNENNGFVSCVFENIKTGDLVIGFRGTERPGLGENMNDLISLGKDVQADINLVACVFDEQFFDAYDFYKLVKTQYPSAKISIVGQSLGGALAQITAAKIYSVTEEKVKTYTYNAPGCKHLLELYGCNIKANYSFITNYAVMNDWCGMFGEKVGETYLIPPIPLNKVETDSTADILNNILLTSHEGIFEYSGKVIKKPDNFSQQEGLALWFFDENNPVKEIGSISDYINTNFPQFSSPQLETVGKTVQNGENMVQKDNNTSFLEFSAQLQAAATNFINEQIEKINEIINKNTIGMISQFLEKTFSELTPDNLKSALKFLQKERIHKSHPEYFESLTKLSKQL